MIIFISGGKTAVRLTYLWNGGSRDIRMRGDTKTIPTELIVYLYLINDQLYCIINR